LYGEVETIERFNVFLNFLFIAMLGYNRFFSVTVYCDEKAGFILMYMLDSKPVSLDSYSRTCGRLSDGDILT